MVAEKASATAYAGSGYMVNFTVVKSLYNAL